jgi:hypothetical protein
VDSIPFDHSAWHTYRLYTPGNSNQVQLYIDNRLRLTTTAQPDTTHNGFDWGDGLSLPGNGANVDWDYVRVYQGDRPPIGPPPPPPRYDPEPAPSASKLVVVTHGWANDTPDSTTLAWLSNVRDSIRAEIDSRLTDEMDDWKVIAYDWTASSGKGRHSDTNIGPFKGFNDAYNNATEHGRDQGVVWADAGYEHVHLIGYSAGAGLLEEAARTIKERSPNTTVHLTFLDAYIPLGRNGADFASAADWVDNYFTRDGVPRTQNIISESHNVDLTALSKAPRPFHTSRFLSKVNRWQNLSRRVR